MKITLEIKTVQPTTYVMVNGVPTLQNVGEPVSKVIKRLLNDQGGVVSEEILPWPLSLAESRVMRCGHIDFRTGDLITGGFIFNGKTFSLSTNAQVNWSNLMNVPDAFFPLTIMTKVDEEYVLELADRTNFYLAALNGKLTHIQSGSSRKIQVNALATIQEVLDFIDNR